MPQIFPRLVVPTAQIRADLRKTEGAHKYAHGHALVLTGGLGRGGAARLGARAALRIGAGLVTVLCPQVALSENAAQLTGVMISVLPDSFTLRGMLQDPRHNAVLLGPGLGLARAREMVPAVLANPRATVLDADALSAYEDDPDLLFRQLHSACVLTPHRGEFARLFPDLAADLNPVEGFAADPNSVPQAICAAVKAAAARAGCTVLLKGAQTLIASPAPLPEDEAAGGPEERGREKRGAEEGDLALHAALGPRAAPWLATAGAGDVLAGLIVGLMARGFAPQQAAEIGAWLHVEAARQFGAGLIAEDLPEQLPAVLRSLFAQDSLTGEGRAD